MKGRTIVVLVLLTIAFIYAVIIFQALSSNGAMKQSSPQTRADVLQMPPPLDLTLISDLESRLVAEQAKQLELSKEMQDLRNQHDSDIIALQLHKSRIKSLLEETGMLSRPDVSTNRNVINTTIYG